MSNRTYLLPATPFTVKGRQDNDLSLTVRISAPSGWLDLQDPDIYEVHSDSFISAAVSWRKQEIVSPYVEGNFITAAVKENVPEQLVVWVKGQDPFDLRDRQQDITDALDQREFTIMMRVGNMSEYWTVLEPADYTVEYQREHRHALRCIIRATVSRQPTADYGPAAQDEL